VLLRGENMHLLMCVAASAASAIYARAMLRHFGLPFQLMMRRKDSVLHLQFALCAVLTTAARDLAGSTLQADGAPACTTGQGCSVGDAKHE